MDSESIIKTLYSRLTTQRYTNNTIRAYTSYAQLFLDHMKNHQTLVDIPISEIEAFINTKVDHDKISASYQHSLVGAIKKIYELVKHQKIELDYLYPKRNETKLPNFFSQDEVRNILNACENLKHKAILTTIYSCGLRLSELLNIKITDVKSDSDLLFIRQSKGNKDRVIALPNKLIILLREYYLAYKPKVYLFKGGKAGQYSDRSVQLTLKKS